MRFSVWFDDQPGLTQEAFARIVGVTQGRIHQLLGGDVPSLALALRIKAATDGAVTPNDWFHSPAKPRPKPRACA